MRAPSFELRVPSLPCVVDPATFDAYGWCPSDTLEWRRPNGMSHEAGLDPTVAFDGSNPPGLVFVMHAECTFLPRELACLHASGHGCTDEWALAPYAIDDATDGFFEHRVRPRDVLWLAASTLGDLTWGLHDWAHFHNHGTFEDPPTTELQCDLLALAWLRENQQAIGLRHEQLDAVAMGLASLCERRFTDANRAPPVADLVGVFRAPYPKGPLGR